MAAQKNGWWVRVDAGGTEVPEFVLIGGTGDNDRRFWRVWKSGEEAEFDVPADYRNVGTIFIWGIACPEDRNVKFDLYYGDAHRRSWSFDNHEDARVDQ